MGYIDLDNPVPRAVRADKVRGVHIAVVTDLSDPDKMYRVKVKLPCLAPSENTFWARIATLMTGGDRGTFVLPEVDDQVLVVFEHGDVDRPIIIGSVWNEK